MIETFIVKIILDRAGADLNEHGIENARSDAEILLMHVIKKNKAWLLSHSEQPIKQNQYFKFNKLLKRRAKHEPISYIIGTKEFYSLSFLVNKHVLIPRPETELLVDTVLELNLKGKNILDICCGSGIIGISVKYNQPDCSVVCADISSDAIKIAKKNSKLLLDSLPIKFKKSDIYKGINNKYDFIVSNPPYILSSEMKELDETVKYEPVLALEAGQDGMKVYKKLIANAPVYLENKGYLMIEINPSLHDELIKLAISSGMEYIDTKYDYNNKKRVLVFKNNV